MQTYKRIVLLALLLIAVFAALAFANPAVTYADAPVSNPVPQTTPEPVTEEIAPSGPPLSLTISLLCFCLTFSLVIGVFVLGVIVRRPGREDKEIEKAKQEHGL